MTPTLSRIHSLANAYREAVTANDAAKASSAAADLIPLLTEFAIDERKHARLIGGWAFWVEGEPAGLRMEAIAS